MSFTRNTSIAVKTEIAFTERTKNIYAARGACIYATQKLLSSGKKEKTRTGGKVEKFKKSRGTDSRKINKSSGSWAPSNSPYSTRIGDRNCEVLISDESGKINVNKITDDTRASFIKFLIAYKLEELVAETITDSILDWLDEDDLHHINGAEKEFYATLPEPYEPKNGPFESLEELALVKGITPEIFELLREHLTIYGSGKININFASKEVLLAVPLMTGEIAGAIVQLRKKKGRIKKLSTVKEVFRHFGIVGKDYLKIMEYLTIDDSNYITINSVASSGKVKNSYNLLVHKGVGNCKIIAAYPE